MSSGLEMSQVPVGQLSEWICGSEALERFQCGERGGA